ncbi:hypothetical protein ACIQ7D_10265 [Streptomyces sp. NPDC096310]|uniref:hypothetical protein n=1 Tax=Streptomyces sp. NPDC096310 TaxID=3366082 RepID=UPI00382B8CBA
MSVPPKEIPPVSEDISDGIEDVVGVLTERIEAHFGMGMDWLKAAVAAAPLVHRDASAVITMHRLLVHAQTALDRAEDDLLAALEETQPGEWVDDPTMALVHRVASAVTVRDGWAVAVQQLLAQDARGTQDGRAQGSRVAGARRGPAAAATSAPTPSAKVPARHGRGAVR